MPGREYHYLPSMCHASAGFQRYPPLQSSNEQVANIIYSDMLFYAPARDDQDILLTTAKVTGMLFKSGLGGEVDGCITFFYFFGIQDKYSLASTSIKKLERRRGMGC